MGDKIGNMRERVTIQQESRTPDNEGGAAIAWPDIATVYASIRPLSGREQAARGGLEASQMYEVVIRRNPSISVVAALRFVWGSVILNVRNVRNVDERGEFLTCDCESGVVT